MEIREYLKAKRRWLPALVAVPLLAAAATVGYVSLQPAETTAEVRGFVPPSLTNSDSQIGLYLARLDEALRLDTVRSDIVAAAEIRPNQVSQVGVERNGQSDQFTLSVVSTAPEERAVAIAEAAAKIGTAFVAQQSLQGADITTDLARQNFEAAQSEMFAYQDEIGDLDPNVTYANVSRELLDPGSTTDVGALVAQQQELVGQVRRFNELRAVFQSTSSALGTAQAQSNGRSAEIIGAESGSQILFTEVVQDQFPGMRYVEPAGLSLVLAFVVVLGLSLLPDLLRRTPPGPATVSRAGAGPPVTGPDAYDGRPEPRLLPPRSEAARSNGAPVSSGRPTPGRRD